MHISSQDLWIPIQTSFHRCIAAVSGIEPPYIDQQLTENFRTRSPNGHLLCKSKRPENDKVKPQLSMFPKNRHHMVHHKKPPYIDFKKEQHCWAPQPTLKKSVYITSQLLKQQKHLGRTGGHQVGQPPRRGVRWSEAPWMTLPPLPSALSVMLQPPRW